MLRNLHIIDSDDYNIISRRARVYSSSSHECKPLIPSWSQIWPAKVFSQKHFRSDIHGIFNVDFCLIDQKIYLNLWCSGSALHCWFSPCSSSLDSEVQWSRWTWKVPTEQQQKNVLKKRVQCKCHRQFISRHSSARNKQPPEEHLPETHHLIGSVK